MRNVAGLVICLSATWLAWSGHTTGLLLGLGAGSVALSVYLCWRMKIIDADGNLLMIAPRMLRYSPWLAWQVLCSNIAMTRIILDPRLPISPRVIRISSSQRGELARAIYANSITLTPGTVTMSVDGSELIVHAITRRCAEAFQSQEMDQMVCRVFESARTDS